MPYATTASTLTSHLAATNNTVSYSDAAAAAAVARGRSNVVHHQQSACKCCIGIYTSYFVLRFGKFPELTGKTGDEMSTSELNSFIPGLKPSFSASNTPFLIGPVRVYPLLEGIWLVSPVFTQTDHAT